MEPDLTDDLVRVGSDLVMVPGKAFEVNSGARANGPRQEARVVKQVLELGSRRVLIEGVELKHIAPQLLKWPGRTASASKPSLPTLGRELPAPLLARSTDAHLMPILVAQAAVPAGFCVDYTWVEDNSIQMGSGTWVVDGQVYLSSIYLCCGAVVKTTPWGGITVSGGTTIYGPVTFTSVFDNSPGAGDDVGGDYGYADPNQNWAGTHLRLQGATIDSGYEYWGDAEFRYAYCGLSVDYMEGQTIHINNLTLNSVSEGLNVWDIAAIHIAQANHCNVGSVFYEGYPGTVQIGSLNQTCGGSAGSIAFQSGTYSVGEGNGSVWICIRRTDGSAGEAGVYYYTGDGSANWGSDYSYTSGQITWAAGEDHDQWIEVPIHDDSIYEGDQSFAVYLYDEWGASLGNPSQTTVTILDNESPPPPSCITPPANLLGWWAAEGNGNDRSGNNYHASLEGDAGFVGGKVGQSFSFDGSGDYATVASFPDLTSQLTIELWVKRQRLGTYDYLIEKGGDWLCGGQQNFAVQFHGPDNDVVFSWAGGYRGAGSIADYNWHHLAVTAVSGQANPMIYVDGVARSITLAGGSTTMNFPSYNRPLHLGAQVDPNSGWHYYSQTWIDELSVYNRALNASEIQAIYTAGAAGKCPPASPTRIISLTGDLAFGNVPVNTTVQRTLTINNTGNSALTVSGINYPSGFSGSWNGGTIAPGGSQNITVTFAPTTASSYSGTVTVNSDATSGTSTTSASGTGTSTGADLVAHWPMDDGSGTTVTDSIGGHPGTLIGGTTWVVPGQVGNGALAFDGVDDKMTFSPLPLTTTFSVVMWIRPVPGSDDYGTLLAQGNVKGIWYRGAPPVRRCLTNSIQR